VRKIKIWSREEEPAIKGQSACPSTAWKEEGNAIGNKPKIKNQAHKLHQKSAGGPGIFEKKKKYQDMAEREET